MEILFHRNKKKTKTFFIFSGFVFICLFSACNTTKFVPEGEYLLNKITINSDTKEVPKDELKGYLRQNTNSSVLGFFKMQLGVYSLAGKDSTKRFNRFLKKIGEEPVLYDASLSSISRQQLHLTMQNKGFINAVVSDTVIITKEKKAHVIYNITSNTPYRINTYGSNIENQELTNIVADTVRSLIKSDMLFDVDVLEKERERVASRFRQSGHYNFNKEWLSFVADSSLSSHKMDIWMEFNERVKTLPDSVEDLLFRKYRIRNVIFQITEDIGYGDTIANVVKDTLQRDGFILITPQDRFLRFGILIQNTYIVPGNYYNDFGLDRTYSALNSLSAVKYVNINFRYVGDSLLDCNIYLAPSKVISFSVEAEATYTEGYWGIAGNVNAQHKNLFKGAEVLTLQGRMAIEKQGDVFAREFGGQVGLQFPNFMVPLATMNLRRRIRAKTEFTTNLNYQLRPQEYTMTNVGAGVKYIWNYGRTRNTLDLIDLSYIYFPNISTEFNDIYIESGIYNKYNYQDNLIMRLGYSGSTSQFNPNRPLRSYSTYRYNIETAGNLLNGISHLFDGERAEDGSYKFFNIRYAQYIKGDFSISYNQIIDKNNRFVYRAAVGVGFPYGNADIIPYGRRFFSGGANSVRGWSENMLGPGVYRRITAAGRRDFNQSGDIKLDLNMEYRAKMFWVLESALFLDAGNIWTIKDYPEQPGGVFDLNFINQIAASYGFGIRADFSFFLLRVDLGVKLYDPALNRRESWRIQPKLREDFALHFAIGYPF